MTIKERNKRIKIYKEFIKKCNNQLELLKSLIISNNIYTMDRIELLREFEKIVSMKAQDELLIEQLKHNKIIY